MKFPTDFQKLGGIEASRIRFIGQWHSVEGLQKAREIFGEGAKGRILVCVGFGGASDVRSGFLSVIGNQQRISVGAWRKQKRIECEHLQAVAFKFEVPNNRTGK